MLSVSFRREPRASSTFASAVLLILLVHRSIRVHSTTVGMHCGRGAVATPTCWCVLTTRAVLTLPLHCLLLLSAASVAAPETFRQPKYDSLHSQTDGVFLNKNTVSFSFLAHAAMFFGWSTFKKD